MCIIELQEKGYLVQFSCECKWQCGPAPVTKCMAEKLKRTQVPGHKRIIWDSLHHQKEHLSLCCPPHLLCHLQPHHLLFSLSSTCLNTQIVHCRLTHYHLSTTLWAISPILTAAPSTARCWPPQNSMPSPHPGVALDQSTATLSSRSS